MKHFFKRTMAYVFDCLICYTFVMIFFQWAFLSNFREIIGITNDWFSKSLNLQLYVFLTISLPVWLYFTYTDSIQSNGTIGKRTMKLKVLNYNDEKIGLNRNFLRTALKLAPWEISHMGVIFPSPLYFAQNPEIRILTIFGITLFAAYVGSIVIDSDRQSLYDRLTGTKVVER